MSTHPRAAPPHRSADFATQANQAIEAAANERAAPLTKDDFARRWGFASFLEIFEASRPVGNAGGKKKWLLTALREGKFLLWNDAEIGGAQEFDSRDEALASIEAM